MTRWGYDEPRGIIIGGSYVAVQVYYEDRPQGQLMTADTEADAIDKAKQFINHLRSEYQTIGLYPDDAAWRLKVSN